MFGLYPHYPLLLYFLLGSGEKITTDSKTETHCAAKEVNFFFYSFFSLQFRVKFGFSFFFNSFEISSYFTCNWGDVGIKFFLQIKLLNKTLFHKKTEKDELL